MKKTLLTLFSLVFAMFTASAQTNLIENGDFETWAEGAPVNWKSTTSASSADLSQSKIAHSGSFSVLIAGNAKYNKRIAYKEITLKPGTYTVKAFAKATSADTAGIKLGYVEVKDGKAANYNYQDVATDLVEDWTALTYEFELTATTQVNLIAMNSKTPKGANKYGKDILFDDYTITTTNGGIAEDGDVNPEPTPDPEPQPQPEDDAIFAETFAEGVGTFTIDNKVLPAGVTNVWQFASNYKCMKASAFISGKAYATESWLVSPVVDLTKATDAVLSFENAANKFNGTPVAEACLVKVKAEGADWVNATIENIPAGNSWDFQTSTVDLKAYNGKKIQIAFVYISTEKSAGAWEVNMVKIAGKGGEVNPEPQPEPQPEDKGVFSETFAEGVGTFTIDDKVMPEGSKYIWQYSKYGNNAYMKASAFFGGNMHASESWLVSPVIDLTKVQASVLTFENAANKFFETPVKDACLVKVKAEGAAWTDVVVNQLPDGKSWDFVTSTVDLKAFDGKKVQIAFVYTSTDQVAGTWEVKNVKVDGNTATGIEAVETENGAQVIYDLAGRRVAKAVKGLYIINGKKVYVK